MEQLEKWIEEFVCGSFGLELPTTENFEKLTQISLEYKTRNGLNGGEYYSDTIENTLKLKSFSSQFFSSFQSVLDKTIDNHVIELRKQHMQQLPPDLIRLIISFISHTSPYSLMMGIGNHHEVNPYLLVNKTWWSTLAPLVMKRLTTGPIGINKTIGDKVSLAHLFPLGYFSKEWTIPNSLKNIGVIETQESYFSTKHIRKRDKFIDMLSASNVSINRMIVRETTFNSDKYLELIPLVCKKYKHTLATMKNKPLMLVKFGSQLILGSKNTLYSPHSILFACNRSIRLKWAAKNIIQTFESNSWKHNFEKDESDRRFNRAKDVTLIFVQPCTKKYVIGIVNTLKDAKQLFEEICKTWDGIYVPPQN